jgi:hypothetical protein
VLAVSNVVPLHGGEPVDLVDALVDGVQREAARRAVRRHCEIAIVAAFDLGDPAHAVSQLREAIAVINALSLEPPPAPLSRYGRRTPEATNRERSGHEG